MLTEEQKVQYETFGFAVFKGLFSPAAASVIREEFEVGLAAERGRLGTPELPTYFSALGPETPFMASLPEDPRFVEAAEHVGRGRGGNRLGWPALHQTQHVLAPRPARRYFGDEGQPLAGRQVRLLSEVAGRRYRRAQADSGVLPVPVPRRDLGHWLEERRRRVGG